MTSASPVVPNIKGAPISTSKPWIRETYGEDLYRRALAAVSQETREMVEGEILSSSWYPVQRWEEFLAAVAAEVRRTAGQDANTFYYHLMTHSGSQTLQKIYGWVLNLFEPTTAISKIVPIFRRIYDAGKVDVVSNEPGKCTLSFHSAPVAMLDSVRLQFPLAIRWILETAGQTVTSSAITKSVVTGDTFHVEVTTSYNKKQKR